MTTTQNIDNAREKEECEKEKSQKAGRKFLLGLILFFLAVATVDGYFVYKALSTHTGVVVDKPYERGLKYNEIIAEAKRQKDERNNAGD